MGRERGGGEGRFPLRYNLDLLSAGSKVKLLCRSIPGANQKLGCIYPHDLRAAQARGLHYPRVNAHEMSREQSRATRAGNNPTFAR